MKTGHEIETDRLRIRGWTLSDEDRAVFHRLNSDPQVMRYFPFRRTSAETDALLELVLKMSREQGYGWAAVCLKDTHEVIGFSGIADVNYFSAAFLPADEIGWRLLPEHWHKGYATEAAAALLAHAFDVLRRKRIVSFAVTENTASINVMKRIGMVAEPHFDFDHPNAPDTQPHLKRHVVYAANRP
ncbi:MAG: GNAT family N-acetyltransferase [Rhizobiaceae bacterium]